MLPGSNFLRHAAVRVVALLVTCGLLGAYLALRSLGVHAPSAKTPPPPEHVASAEVVLSPVEPSPARTDRGRDVAMLRRTDSHQPWTGQDKALEEFGLKGRVLQLPTRWQDCNCHGWILAAGQYHIAYESMPAILEDNGYARVSDPRIGDLVIYVNQQGEMSHSGIVRHVGDNVILVEGKWGYQGGRILHPHDTLYENCTYEFYRSERVGHVLRGLSTTAS